MGSYTVAEYYVCKGLRGIEPGILRLAILLELQ